MKNRELINYRIKTLEEYTGLKLTIDAYSPGDKYGTRIRIAEQVGDSGGISNIGLYTLGTTNFVDMLDTMIELLRRAEQRKQEVKA